MSDYTAFPTRPGLSGIAESLASAAINGLTQRATVRNGLQMSLEDAAQNVRHYHQDIVTATKSLAADCQDRFGPSDLPLNIATVLTSSLVANLVASGVSVDDSLRQVGRQRQFILRAAEGLTREDYPEVTTALVGGIAGGLVRQTKDVKESLDRAVAKRGACSAGATALVDMSPIDDQMDERLRFSTTHYAVALNGLIARGVGVDEALTTTRHQRENFVARANMAFEKARDFHAVRAERNVPAAPSSKPGLK